LDLAECKLAARAAQEPLVLELLAGDYLDARENILIVGPSGTGKTHVASALGVAACAAGKRCGSSA
jgi:DNA replication protein DnaC